MKLTIEGIKKRKNGEKIVMITAYDALFAKLMAPTADMILVGDSLSMSFGGARDTLGCTMDMMIYHTKAVCAGASESFVVTDMPFGSIATPQIALDNAMRVYKEAFADAVKIEGGVDKAPLIRHLCDHGIAVVGHIGLLPQNVRGEGGYKVKGRTPEGVASLIADAQAIEEAGVFCMVLEGVQADAARQVAQAVRVPVIGIGAGRDVDGQVLVFSDMLGFFEAFKPKFVRHYLNGADRVKEAFETYAKEVRSGAFPAKEESY